MSRIGWALPFLVAALIAACGSSGGSSSSGSGQQVGDASVDSGAGMPGADAGGPDASLDAPVDTASGCGAVSCKTFGLTCGTIPDGCGNVLYCGSCEAGTCGGGGAAGTCGCTPLTCAKLDFSCGTIPDGCGNTVDCGSCEAGTCGGGGKPGVCGSGGACMKATCAQLGVTCGSAPDGCGGMLSCGTCEPAGGTCGGGGVAGQCGCTKLTCAALGFNCGTWPDGCGGTLDCGTCEAGACSAGGVPGQCGNGCVKSTCASLGYSCGVWPDGCGGTLSCGACEAGTCGGSGTPGVCGCAKLTCAGLGYTCGTWSDGCGGTLSCGSCEGGVCGGGGTPGVCACAPTTCAAQGASCGSLSDGCGGTLSCGSCTSPLACSAINVCACPAGQMQVGDTCEPIPPPRQIAPLSTAHVTSRQPTVSWLLAPGTDGARVDFCSDPACGSVIQTRNATGSSTQPATNLPVGAVYWRLTGMLQSNAGAATSPIWEMLVPATGASVSSAWGSALDVNMDGFADVVTSQGQDPYSYYDGLAVYDGSSTGIPNGSPATPTQEINDPIAANGDYFGLSIASAGDVNGDGYADLIVGAPGSNKAFLYLGGAGGLEQTPHVTLTGSGDSFGWSVAGAGDVNGDGYGDVLVGQPALSNGDYPYVFVYYGASSQTLPQPNTIFANQAAQTIRGTTLSDFGVSAAGAGDLNADGYGDVVVGAPGQGSGSQGFAYVYLGSSTGLGLSAPVTLVGPDCCLFGVSVAGVGDVENKGYSGIVIAAGNTTTATKAYFWQGMTPGTTTTNPLTSTPQVTFAGIGNPYSSPTAFYIEVAAAGDTNLDGYDDIAVGASNNGKVYVFPGGSGGPSTTASPTLATNGSTVTGDFGIALSGGGDVNGDKVGDLTVGSYSASSYYGVSYVYEGVANSGLGTTPSSILTQVSPRNGWGGGSAVAE